MIKEIDAILIGYVEVGESVVVIIRSNYSFTEGGLVDSCQMSHLFKRSVTLVVKQLRWSVLVRDKQIQVSVVVVDVSPRSSLGLSHGCPQATGICHVGECAVTVVAQQGFALGKLPPGTQH